MEKLRHWDVKLLSQDHMVSKWQNRALNSLLVWELDSVLLITTLHLKMFWTSYIKSSILVRPWNTIRYFWVPISELTFELFMEHEACWETDILQCESPLCAETLSTGLSNSCGLADPHYPVAVLLTPVSSWKLERTYTSRLVTLGSLIPSLFNKNIIIFSPCHDMKKVGKPCFRELWKGKRENIWVVFVPCHPCHSLHIKAIARESEADSSLWTWLVQVSLT